MTVTQTSPADHAPQPGPSAARSTPSPPPSTSNPRSHAAMRGEQHARTSTGTGTGLGLGPHLPEEAPPVRMLGINYVPADADAGEDGFMDELADRTALGAERGRLAHPLRLDVHAPSPSPSPPPWEVVAPPSANGRTHADADWPTKPETAFPKTQTARRLIPVSSYYFGPPPSDAAYGTPPVGQLGVHHPREIVRVERDYSGGDVVQFAPTYPLEFEGRITPTQFLETVNAINELLIAAHSLRHSFVDNFLDIFTLHLSKLVLTSHYDRQMRRLQHLIDELNSELYNPVGLNIVWPRKVAFLFLEIEYY